MPPAPPPADPFDPATVKQATTQILALVAGTEYTMPVVGDCMRPAGVFDGDTVILRRQAHAADGQIVLAHYPGQPPGTRWLGLKHYHQAGAWVRLAAADPRYPPMAFRPDEVQVLGVLVGIDGTTALPDGARGCGMHRRFLRPTCCATCAVLADPAVGIAPLGGDLPARDPAALPVVVAAADPDGPPDLAAHHARLLGQLAAQLPDQATYGGGQPTRAVVLDLDDDTDPINVYNALLQGAAALTQNQQLHGHLERLSGEHALVALTAAHMWTLLDHAAAALAAHLGPTDPASRLVVALRQMRELGELPIGQVPAVGVELHDELEAAREVLAALDALDQADDHAPSGYEVVDRASGAVVDRIDTSKLSPSERAGRAGRLAAAAAPARPPVGASHGHDLDAAAAATEGRRRRRAPPLGAAAPRRRPPGVRRPGRRSRPRPHRPIAPHALVPWK